jgi:Up-regulated During Septation
VESKIRDAASSLSKLSDSPGKRESAKPAVTDQFETAQGKVDAAQRELFKASERAADVHRRLLEHRTAVLSFTVRNVDQPPLAEGTEGSDNGTSATTVSGDLSPVSTAATSISVSSRTKFEGPHFYAGHSDAIIPGPSRPPPTWKEFSALQEKLVAANEAAASAKRKAAEYLREVSVLNLEKSGIETQASLDVQISEETVASLESELTRMKKLERQLQETLHKKDAELENSRGMVSSAELEARDSEIRQLKARWEEEVASLNAQLSDAQSSKNVSEELEAGRASFLELLGSLNATVPTGTTTLPILADVLATHVSLMRNRLEANEKSAVAWEVEKKQFEAEITRGVEAHERILKEIDDARHEGEELRSKNQTLEIQLRVSLPLPYLLRLRLNKPACPRNDPQSHLYLPIFLLTRFVLNTNVSLPCYCVCGALFLPRKLAPRSASNRILIPNLPNLPGLFLHVPRRFQIWMYVPLNLFTILLPPPILPRLSRKTSLSMHSLSVFRHCCLTTGHLSSDSFVSRKVTIC